MLSVIYAIAGAAVLALLWKMLYDSTHFEITEYRIADPRIRKSFRAVVLADLHNKQYGRGNELLLEKIREGAPDMVFAAGDLLTAKPGADPRPALSLIRELAKDFPVYYGSGNHEHRIKLYREEYGELAEIFEEGLRECGVAPLVNERRTLEEFGVCVVGAELPKEYYRRFQVSPMADDYLRELLGEPDRERYTVLLAHNPDYFPEYAGWGADLTLSGHIHGGVVRIPFWNRGLVSPAIRLFPKYDGGLYTEGEQAMILSRGLGSHTIPVRLFNPGDLIFLEFSPGAEKSLPRLLRRKQDGRAENSGADKKER